MNSGVSVIICCYNSTQRLPETLKYLSNQEADISWEVILVDNASTDETKTFAHNFWNDHGPANVPMVIVDEPMQGLSHARNKGVAAASFDFIIFCDDDNWLNPSYVHQAFTLLNENPRAGALGGTGTPISDSPLPSWFDAYKYCYACYPQAECDGELTNATASLYGAGLVIRKKIFKELIDHGFKPVLTDRTGTRLTSGGDTELCFAIRLLGYSLVFSTNLQFFHYIPSSRLTTSYLIKLNRSLSHCSVKLLVYRYLLTGKNVTTRVWIKDMMYQSMLFLKSIIRYVNVFSKARLERQMQLDFSFHALIGLLPQYNTYQSTYNSLCSLKNKPNDR